MSIDRAAAIAVALAIALAAGVRSGPAAAQADDAAAIATRRQLIESAQQARDRGDHAAALDAAQRAATLRSSGTLRRFVAEELLQVGRFAEALGAAEQCETELNADPQVRNIPEHHRACHEVARTARQHVGAVIVRVPTPVPDGLIVRVAGSALAPVLWGAPNVVSAGSVEIDATAPGWRPFHARIDVGAGATVSVPVEMVAEAATQAQGPGASTPDSDATLPQSTVSTATTTQPARDHADLDRAVPAEPRPSGSRTNSGFGAGGIALLGGVGLAIGMFAWAVSVTADWDSRCVDQDSMFDLCTAQQYGQQTAVDLLNVAGIAGIAIATGGAVLMLRAALSGHSSDTPRHARRASSWRLGITRGGVVVGATW